MRRLLLVWVVLAAGCAELKQIAASAFQQPKLEFQSVSIQSLDLEGATLAFDFRIENPNGIGLDVAKIGYALDVEGTRVVDGEAPGGVSIPAHGAAPVRFPVHFRFADVPGFVRLVTSREALAYRLSGHAGVRTPIGIVDLPLSYASTVAAPRLPTLGIDAVQVRSVSFTDVALDVKLTVHNPNAVPLPVGSVSYAVSVAGSPLVSGDGRAVASVPARGSAAVALPVRMSLAGAGRAASQLVSGSGAVDVGVKGTATFGNVPIPIDFAAKVPALR